MARSRPGLGWRRCADEADRMERGARRPRWRDPLGARCRRGDAGSLAPRADAHRARARSVGLAGARAPVDESGVPKEMSMTTTRRAFLRSGVRSAVALALAAG